MFRKADGQLKWIQTLILLVGSLAPAGLFADSVTLRGEVWAGTMEPELENRFFMDDLIGGNVNGSFGFGRYNMAWTNEDRTSSSFGVEYAKTFQDGKIILSFAGERHYPEYGFMGFDASPNLSIVTLDNYRITNFDYEAGFEINVIKNILFITPRVGLRNHYKTFQMNDTTFGSGVYVFTNSSQFEADVYGTYLGLDAQFFVTQNFAINGGYFRSSPIIGNVSGDMTYDMERIGFSGNSAYYQIDKATADYEMKMTKMMLGGEFFLSKTVSLEAGWKYEEMEHRYPNYFNLPITIANNSIDTSAVIGEMITDRIFYDQSQTTTKSSIYGAINFKIDL